MYICCVHVMHMNAASVHMAIHIYIHTHMHACMPCSILIFILLTNHVQVVRSLAALLEPLIDVGPTADPTVYLQAVRAINRIANQNSDSVRSLMKVRAALVCTPCMCASCTRVSDVINALDAMFMCRPCMGECMYQATFCISKHVFV
jgi:hypothetical protein